MILKRITKRILTALLAFVLIVSGSTTFFAETIYYYYGYHYTIINNDSVSLCGLDEDISILEVPDTIYKRAVVEIANYAFTDDEKITSIDFSKASNLERIGTFTFKGCTNLNGEIIIPQSVRTIDSAAFQACTSLESVVIDASVTLLPQQCFYQCAALKSVKLNDTITEIGHYAFSGCANLNYMEIPASITQIADTAFNGDTITLGVYTNTAAHQYAIDHNIPFILLDAPVPPTEPPTDAPTEPITPTDAPTEVPTAEPTQQPTQPVTEAPTEAAVFILGDANGDNSVDVTDATVMQRYLANMHYIDEKVIMHGDVDGDGEISIQDVTFTLRYLASIEIPYPIDQPIKK